MPVKEDRTRLKGSAKAFPSPLSYPGGKSRFFKSILPYLKNRNYAEPFAGGAGLGLKLLYEGHIDHLHLNEIDSGLVDFWRAVTTQPGALLEKLEQATVDMAGWSYYRSIYLDGNAPPLERGFATLYLNRVNFSGKLHKGLPVGGMKQSGSYKLDCQFNKETISKKIEMVAQFSNKISVTKMDAIEFIKKFSEEKDAVLFVDPPYLKRGARIYKHIYRPACHHKLAELLNDIAYKCPWFLTHTPDAYIEELYCRFHFNRVEQPYSFNVRRQFEKEMMFVNLPHMMEAA